MHLRDCVNLTRRDFLATGASRLSLLAMASVLREQGLLAAAIGSAGTPRPTKVAHFPGKARSCIFIFMEGAPSQMDLFDPKPKLNELNGQPLPESLLKNVRFAFIKKETARLMGSPRTFKKYGQCGMDFSDLLPHLGSCADDLLMV